MHDQTGTDCIANHAVVKKRKMRTAQNVDSGKEPVLAWVKKMHRTLTKRGLYDSRDRNSQNVSG